MTPSTGLLGARGFRPARPTGRLPEPPSSPDDVSRRRGPLASPGRTAWEVLVVTAMAWLLVAACLAGWSLLPMLVGWRPVVITSGSMSPAIRPGDVVLVDPDARDVQVGHVVYVKPLRPGAAPVTHRVVRIEDDGDLITRGDANRVDDSTPVPPDRVGGIARLAVPNAGRIALAWLRHDPADLAWAGVTGLAVLVTAVSLWRRDPAEDLVPVRDEDEHLSQADEHPFFGPGPEPAEPAAEPELPPHSGTHHGTASHATTRRTPTTDGLSYDLGLGYPTDSVFVPAPRIPALPERLVEDSADLLPPETPELPEPPREPLDLPVLRLLPATHDRHAPVIGVRETWARAYIPLQHGRPAARHATKR